MFSIRLICSQASKTSSLTMRFNQLFTKLENLASSPKKWMSFQRSVVTYLMTIKHWLILQYGEVVLITLPKRRLGRIKGQIRKRLEVWKEVLPSINMSELHRLICRLKRHATVLAYKYELGKVVLILGYNSLRQRISTRVLLSSWVGKRRCQSIRLRSFKPTVSL